MLALNRVEWMRIEDGAACMIQSCFRGYLARKKLKFEKDQNRSAKSVRAQSCEQVQRKSKFVNANEYALYVKQIKRELSGVTKEVQKKKKKFLPNNRHAVVILNELEQKKSEIWTKFTKKKKEIKKEHFDSNGRPKQKIEID